MPKYDIELELAPNIDPQWSEEFILEARLRDVPGTTIGDALGEINDHCRSSGESPLSAFGAARDYAASIAQDSNPADGPKLTILLLPAPLLIVGLFLGLNGVYGVAAEIRHPLSWSTLASLGIFAVLLPFVGLLASWLIKVIVRHRAIGYLGAGAIIAMLSVASYFVAFNRPQHSDLWYVPLHAWTVFFLGIAFLIAGTIAEVIIANCPSLQDPLVRAGHEKEADAQPSRFRFLSSTYALICMIVASLIVVLLV